MPKIGEIKRGREISYGTPSSRYIWINCNVCGVNPKWKQLVKGKVVYPRCQSCANRHFGKTNPAWKGGRTKRCDGYVFILLRPNSSFHTMANSQGYVLEHRLVVARQLQRPLESWEVVHHKNGIRFDNRFENLELLPNRKYHTVDTVTKSLLKQQEYRIKEQAKQIRLLTWRIKQIEEVLHPELNKERRTK